LQSRFAGHTDKRRRMRRRAAGKKRGDMTGAGIKFFEWME